MALTPATTHDWPHRLAREMSLLLGSRMPAGKPLGITLQIGANQLEFRRRQPADLQFASGT